MSAIGDDSHLHCVDALSNAMPQDSPSRRLDQFIVRFPEGMRDSIAEEAKKNGRSMNAEIVARLSASLSLPPASLPEITLRHRQIAQELDAIQSRLDELYEGDPPLAGKGTS